MTRLEQLKIDLKIKWLMANTQLQKQKIAKLIGINTSTVSRHTEVHRKHRKQRQLTEEQIAEYNDYCEYIEELVDELMGV